MADAETFATPITWAECLLPDASLVKLAEVDLNDPGAYYGGYAAPWVTNFHAVSRALSDRRQQFEHMVFGLTASDATRWLRTLLEDDVNQFLLYRPFLLRTIDDAERRAGVVTPRLIANGVLTAAQPTSGFEAELVGTDFLGARLERGSKAETSWQPAIDVATFGESCPQESRSLKMPIIYGEIDPAPPTPPAATVYPRGGAVPGVGDRWSANRYAGSSGGSIPNPTDLVVYITLIRAGVEYDFAFPLGTTVSGTAEQYYFGIYDYQAGDVYRLYFSTSAAFNPFDASTFAGARFVDLTPGVNTTDEPGEGTNAQGYKLTSLSAGTLLTGEAGAGTNRGGSVKLIPVGTEQLVVGGDFWNAFLVAGHACAAVPRVYRNDVLVTDWGGLGGSEILCPGQTGWSTFFGSTLYRTRGSRRVTLIYAKGATALAALDGTAPLTVDVEGIEDVGDCTGTLIRAAIDQYKHFARNYLAPEVPDPTTWLTSSPTFAGDATVSMVDDDSFDDVHTEQMRVLTTADEHEGATIIGAGGEAVAMLDVLARFNLANGCDAYPSRKGAYAVSREPIGQLAAPVTISDQFEVLEDSFGFEDVLEDLFPILHFAHTRDYSGRGALIAAATLTTSERRADWAVSTEFGTEPLTDAAGVSHYGARESHVFEVHGLRNTTTTGAAAIAALLPWYHYRAARRRRTVIGRVPYHVGVVLEVGQVIAINAAEGTGAAGWTGRQLRIAAMKTDPSGLFVDLGCYDVTPLQNAVWDGARGGWSAPGARWGI